MNIYYFKITKELLLSFDNTFFRKLNRFLGNFRIEGEDYRGSVIISFYSNEPIKEGWTKNVTIEMKANSKGSWYFTKIIYLQNNK